MKKIHRVLIAVAIFIMVVGTPFHSFAQTKTVVLMFSEGQQPQVFKMPGYAYPGMVALQKNDKVLDACEFEARGKNIYNKAIEFYFKAIDHFLKTNRFIMEDNLRMLVIQKNVNKAFSMSGNVSANFMDSVNNTNTQNLLPPGGSQSKNTANSLSSSGGIFPSYSKSWTDSKYEIWFFMVR